MPHGHDCWQAIPRASHGWCLAIISPEPDGSMHPFLQKLSKLSQLTRLACSSTGAIVTCILFEVSEDRLRYTAQHWLVWIWSARLMLSRTTRASGSERCNGFGRRLSLWDRAAPSHRQGSKSLIGSTWARVLLVQSPCIILVSCKHK